MEGFACAVVNVEERKCGHLGIVLRRTAERKGVGRSIVAQAQKQCAARIATYGGMISKFTTTISACTSRNLYKPIYNDNYVALLISTV
jgi:hypothetical protein